jgi:putative glycosyltransferase
MKLSIVATLYQSAPYIVEFCRRASASANQLVGEEYEIVLVNDGSPDNSLDLAIQLTENDVHVKVVDLSRNFGHHKAMMTGLAHSQGDRIFLIDIDLEEEPEWLLTFAKQMDSEVTDVVYGVQGKRSGRWFKRISGNIFWRIINLLSGLSLPANVVTARLMSRRYVEALLLHKEREVFLAGLLYITGYEQSPLIIKKHAASKTTYTLSRKIDLLVNSITSFSNLPLIWIFYIGLTIVFVSSIYSIVLVFNSIFLSKPLAGYTSLMVSIWLIGGLIILFLGVIGIYLSKVYSEVKRRPYTQVRKIYN